MSRLPRHAAEKLLKELGCDPNGEPGHHEPGYGRWWFSAWGGSFFVQMIEGTDEVDEFTLRRLLGGLSRARPWSALN